MAKSKLDLQKILDKVRRKVKNYDWCATAIEEHFVENAYPRLVEWLAKEILTVKEFEFIDEENNRLVEAVSIIEESFFIYCLGGPEGIIKLAEKLKKEQK